MEPISTASLYQTALTNIMTAEQSEATATAQAASGKVASSLGGYGANSEKLTATLTLQARNNDYITNAQVVSSKLDVQNQALSQVATAAQTAQSAVSDAMATGDASTLMSTLESQLSSASSALNTQYDGQYIFAGGQTGVAPVSVSTLAGLTSATSVASVFNNDQSPTVSRLDDNTTVTTGVLASSVGQPLMQAIQDIANYSNGPNGPLTGTLTSTQSDFLQSVLSEFSSATSAANAAVDQNGVVQSQVSDAQTALQDQQTALQNVVGNITDVDEGQVATNLDLAQTALQASAQVFASLQNDSLLNVLTGSNTL